MKKTLLIVDTDIGSDIDDALCLAYLLNQPRCEILGITTCSSEPEKRAEIADSICRYAGKKIPVFPGLGNPILGKQMQVSVHQYDVVKQLDHETVFPRNSAIDFMRRVIEQHPFEAVILAIGPLTNIGALFAAYPHLIPMIKEVSFLGGSFFEEGLRFLTSEWNIKNDPVAAKIVFASPVNIRVAGLDVSLKLRINCTDFIADTSYASLKPVILYAKKFLERTNDMYFHDALAAAVLFCSDLCQFKHGSVIVDLGTELGRTYFVECQNGNAEVAYSVDAEKFFKHYYDTVS